MLCLFGIYWEAIYKIIEHVRIVVGRGAEDGGNGDNRWSCELLYEKFIRKIIMQEV